MHGLNALTTDGCPFQTSWGARTKRRRVSFCGVGVLVNLDSCVNSVILAMEMMLTVPRKLALATAILAMELLSVRMNEDWLM